MIVNTNSNREFLALTAFSPAEQRYIECMLDARIYGVQEMAIEVGVDIRTIRRYREDARIQRYLAQAAERKMNSILPTVYNTLTGIIEDGASSNQAKLKAIELFLKNRGKLKDKGELEVTADVRTQSTLSEELSDLLGI